MKLMSKTPRSFRCHIGLFGRRNVGKSSLLNAITQQRVSIVSEIAGTTTDPVEKPMELLPLGPVLFIDTAGVDDVGDLGELRMEKTRGIFDRTDLGVIVTAAGEWHPFEEEILSSLRRTETPAIVVFNKSDQGSPPPELLARLASEKVPYVQTVATTDQGILDLRQALLDHAPESFVNNPIIVRDLVPPGEMAVLVIPIDKEAPRGRLILPQQQTIRDLLDGDACCLVVKEKELKDALKRLRQPPQIVITDSQAFLEVAADTPPGILMTSFSILYSRFKGDLIEQVRGTLAVERLRAGDRILIAESCSHHPIEDDIGRVKIPRWIRQYTGLDLEFEYARGHDFPSDVSPYRLIIHCGACMWNRREMLSRIMRCREAGVPISNYGLMIAYSLGIFERALAPFPAALQAYHESSAFR
ncbi:MAG: [FeFe] hydrogenase H-cluster maturation GTPase HydF [Bradymonadales bacterium]|nr:[FeFe] hydrogenase H-cluster maturation GTPase HydF [Bradymonadales bacterium]